MDISSTSSTGSYGNFERNVREKSNVFTSSVLSSKEQGTMCFTPNKVTSDLDSSSIDDYEDFARNLKNNERKVVTSSVVKEVQEVKENVKPPREVKQFELNFSGDEEDSIDPHGYLRNINPHKLRNIVNTFNSSDDSLFASFDEEACRRNCEERWNDPECTFQGTLAQMRSHERIREAVNRSDWSEVMRSPKAVKERRKRRRQEEEEEKRQVAVNLFSLQLPPHTIPSQMEMNVEENDGNKSPEIETIEEEVQQKKKQRKRRNKIQANADGKFPCEECLRPFSQMRHAQHHSYTHMTWEQLEGTKVYHEKCDQCHKIFLNKGNYEAHRNMHNGVRSHQCPTCKKSFIRKGHLLRHLFVHLAVEEKSEVKETWPHKCYFCNNKFKTPSLLNIHMVMHTTEKPFKCLQCKKWFTVNSSLTKHNRSHNTDTRRAFRCEECGAAFTQNSHLTVHQKSVHLGEKNIQCPQCDKKFATKNDMVRHLNAVHLKIRVPCSHCHKTFSQRNTLQAHVKKEHNSKRSK